MAVLGVVSDPIGSVLNVLGAAAVEGAINAPKFRAKRKEASLATPSDRAECEKSVPS